MGARPGAELPGVGEPTQHEPLEGAHVARAVAAAALAGRLPRDVAAEEVREGAVEEAIDVGCPLGVFGLLFAQEGGLR